jgi:NAD(P)H-hydrate epimerase
MIPLYTREEMHEVDRAASGDYGIPSIALMESAGARATDVLHRDYASKLAHVLVVGGEGQNGGDGWVVARHLRSQGLVPTCVLIGSDERVRGDARVNLAALRALGVSVLVLGGHAVEQLALLVQQASLVVDALFGTGLSRNVEGHFARTIELLNQARVPICSLDIPSGVDANRGQVLGCAVWATSTVTFAGQKRGLHQFPGVAHAGRVTCVSIGAKLPDGPRVGLIEDRDVAALLVPAAGDSHKGTRGHVLAIAGSRGKTGAAILAALGAMRAGAGLVTIAADPETQRVLEHKVLELMTAQFDAAAPLASLLTLAEGKASALLGPGFGLDDARRELATSLARELPIPCVLDADALTALGTDLEQLREARAPRILTPHPTEAARLLGRSTDAVQADRYGAASELAVRSGQVVVLKGARTVIATPEGALRICRAGTPALGVAGPERAHAAASAGVQIHALAGEIAAESDRGMLASEVAHAIPRALERIRRSGQPDDASAADA